MTRLLTVPQVAEMLSLAPSTLYAWAASGYLPSVVMHRGSKRPVVRFRAEAIERFIVEREQEQREFIDSSHREREDFRKSVAHLTRKLGG